MNKYIVSAFVLGASAATFTACDDYLDTMPDNRTTLDNEDKVQKMLTSAYPDHEFITATELLADNSDEFPRFNSDGRWWDDTYSWKDEMERDNSSVKNIWEGSYVSIAATNEVLDALGNPTSIKGQQMRAEALVCRAYNHFVLASIFCKAWTQNAEQDLGLPYMTTSEKDLAPKYERGNLKDFYENIQTDLEEGLKNISDDYYTVPKYHFNVKAAWAFACRFYIYTEQWEKAIDAANKVLGTNPSSVLRDWRALSTTSDREANWNMYVDASNPANLLLATGYSNLGYMYGNWGVYSRYNHGITLAALETLGFNYAAAGIGYNRQIFGTHSSIRKRPGYYAGSGIDKVITFKLPFKFEYTDLVAGIGYRHTVTTLFTTDEVLLNRAEAYIMTNQYDLAAADLTTWKNNYTTNTTKLTPEYIQNFYKDLPYAYSDDQKIQSQIKKHLNPAFAIDAEGSVQECMLQCMLCFRRTETLQTGLRWFDIKRYGIEIPRRQIDVNNKPIARTDWLSKDDPRRAVQIPQDVRDAGLAPNPR